MNLETDSFGNVLKSISIGYGRRFDSPDSNLLPHDLEKQRLIHLIYTKNNFTNPIDDKSDAYHTPLPSETRKYELRKSQQERSRTESTRFYQFEHLVRIINQIEDGDHDISFEDIDFIKAKEAVVNHPLESDKYFRRILEHKRIVYRPNDLGESENDPLTLSPLGIIESLALPGEEYHLVFTPGLLAQVFQRNGQSLLLSPTTVLESLGDSGHSGDKGGYLLGQYFKTKGIFPDDDPEDNWWLHTGRLFMSINPQDTAKEELEYATKHYFIPLRYHDPFYTTTVKTENVVLLDAYDLLLKESFDSAGNRITAGERESSPDGQVIVGRQGNDYRVLQPRLITDPNNNKSEVLFDAFGMITVTAIRCRDESRETL